MRVWKLPETGGRNPAAGGCFRQLLNLADDNFLVIVFFLLEKYLAQALCRLLLIHQLILVFAELALDHFLDHVDGGIHVTADLLGAHDISLHWDRDLDFLALLLQGRIKARSGVFAGPQPNTFCLRRECFGQCFWRNTRKGVGDYALYHQRQKY